MRTVTAPAPSGEQWQVRVQWLPRWRFLARRFGGWRRGRRGGSGSDALDATDQLGQVGTGHSGGGGGGGFFDSLGDDIAVAIFVIIGFILFGLVFWFLLLPVLLLVVDLLVVVILCLAAGVARVLLRRPWTVEAVSGEEGARGYRRFTVAVVGWRAALRTRDEIAGKLRQGYPQEAIVGGTAGWWAAPVSYR
jgi:hypothetical protein